MPSQDTRRARPAVVIVGAGLLVVILWGLITTPRLLGPVAVEFSWEKKSGFKYIRTVGKFASVTEEPYKRFLSNPIVVMQAKPRITKMLTDSGFEAAEGRLDFQVAACFFVLGVDHFSENSHVEHYVSSRRD